MAEKKENNDISKLSFEQAIKKLTDIVSKIEDGQVSLEQSLSQYEQGMELIKHCRGILQKAEKKIEQITKQEKEK
jgi:exodeoxyribonuclease VII small subunit